MGLVDTTWYVNAGDQSTTGHYAVAKRPQNTAVTAGQLVRQFTAPAVGSERVFVCIVAGTTANVTDATWVLTRGAKTTDGTATWMECTGQASLNGDLTNTATWAQVKAATPAVLGQVIKRSSGASYQICTTAGAMSASEPTFSDTAGVTTTDTTAVWTSLGVVGNFTGGQAPFARLAATIGTNWYASGNTIYVGDNHAESQSATISFTPTGSSRIFCHNRSGSYPPAVADLRTTAVVSTTGTGQITFNPGTSCYVYGLTLKGGVGSSSGGTYIVLETQGSGWTYWDSCSIQCASTGGSSANFQIGNNTVFATTQTFNNTTVSFGNTAQFLNNIAANLIWQNTGSILAGGSSVPSALFSVTNSAFWFNNLLEGIDLSQIVGNLLATPSSSTPAKGVLMVKDCKLNASMSQTTPILSDIVVQFIRSSSSTPAYTSSRYAYEGTETTEISIVRAGGATDPAGQIQSRKIVTTANAQWLRAFKAEPYAVWNATTGASVTATVYGVTGSGGLPLTDEIWAEFEYLSSGSTTLGAIATTTKSNVLATGTSVASDSSTWGGGTTPFKLAATFTPGQAGYIHARVRAAKASATYYIDPQIILS